MRDCCIAIGTVLGVTSIARRAHGTSSPLSHRDQSSPDGQAPVRIRRRICPLPAGIAFFTALGMTIEGQAPVEGPWVDRVNGLERVQVDIVMMRTPDGPGRLELTKFRNPALVELEPAVAPPNTLGLRSVMFTVESIDDTVARLSATGAELVGEVAQYEDKYKLCYMRGPAGIIVALAEELF